MWTRSGIKTSMSKDTHLGMVSRGQQVFSIVHDEAQPVGAGTLLKKSADLPGHHICVS